MYKVEWLDYHEMKKGDLKCWNLEMIFPNKQTAMSFKKSLLSAKSRPLCDAVTITKVKFMSTLDGGKSSQKTC